MKKIVMFNVLLLLTFSVKAQDNSGKTANSGNVPKELTINGIPYSQYKAEQDALKAKQAANQVINRPGNNTNGTESSIQQKPVQQNVNPQLYHPIISSQTVQQNIVSNQETNSTKNTSSTVNAIVGGNAAGIPTNNAVNQQVNSGQNVPAGSINGMIMPAGANTSNQDTKPAVQQIRVPVTPVQDKPVVNDSKTTNGTTTPNPAMEKLKVTSSSDGNKSVEVKQKN